MKVKKEVAAKEPVVATTPQELAAERIAFARKRLALSETNLRKLAVRVGDAAASVRHWESVIRRNEKLTALTDEEIAAAKAARKIRKPKRIHRGIQL